MLRATILSIGDELTLGQTVDTNSAWLSRQLAAIGIDIAGHLTVPDSRDAIAAAIRTCAEAVDLLLITGGIGPTEDDLTREALADAMGTDLVKDPVALQTLRAYFDRIQRQMPARNEVQTLVPRGAAAIPNSCGTAPGLKARLGACRIYVTPGVPKELYAMWELSIQPELKATAGGGVILSRTLHTFGLGESNVAEKLKAGGNLMDRTRNPSVGTTVSNGIVSVRINARAPSLDEARRELDATHRACVDALGLLIYGTDDESLATVVARTLRGTALTVTAAESCTGGLLAKLLTDEPGSSKFFNQSFVTYSNDAKNRLLGVPNELLLTHGAVSEPVALAMAAGARTAAGADLALAITGIAGPDGGTPEKPVGTVCIALASPDGATARTHHFVGDRETVRDRSAKMALTYLRFHLLNEPLPF